MNQDDIVYVATDKRALWFHLIAPKSLYTGETINDELVVWRSEKLQAEPSQLEPFLDYARDHKAMVWHLQVPELGRSIRLEVAEFCSIQWGATLVVSINSLYDELDLKLHPGTACGWFQKRLRSWRSLATELGLKQEVAVRSSLPWCGNFPAVEGAFRGLTFNSISCHFMVALLSTMAWAAPQSGGIRDPIAKAKAQQVLAAVLELLPANYEVDIALSGEVKWIFGIGVQGGGIVTLSASQGKVRILALKSPETGKELAAPLEDYDDEVRLLDLLRFGVLYRGRMAAATLLFKQLVWPPS